MEADWEFEIGSGAPVIDAQWQGLVDLMADPRRAFDLQEAAQFPSLAEMLVKLNAAHSPIWTSKCDFWSVDPDEAALDANELNAKLDEMTFACACYVDLLARIRERWSNAEDAGRDCAALCAGLRKVPLCCSRSDFIIRQAVFSAGEEAFGVTAYLVACGATEANAHETLSSAATVFADSISSAWLR